MVLVGMWDLQVTDSLADRFYDSANRKQTGYYFGAATTTYVKNCNKWVFGAEYFQRYYPYGDDYLLLYLRIMKLTIR